MKNPIYPCLWFNGNAGNAAAFYNSVFSDLQIISESTLALKLRIMGQDFLLLNGGPEFKPNPSVSFYVVFDSEKGAQDCWNGLATSGEILMPMDKYEWSNKYGWLQDQFGVSWQITAGDVGDVHGQRITPALMFTQEVAGRAEEAMNYYMSLFPDSAVEGIHRCTEENPDDEGTVKHAQFKLDGQLFMAMDSAMTHKFSFNEGVSLVIECDDQQEIDRYWEYLTYGGSESRCGWLKDRYGVSWQIVPAILAILMNDPVKAQKVIPAFMQMKKFDIAALKRAANETDS